MKLRHFSELLELGFILWLAYGFLGAYVPGKPVPQDIFITFVFLPLSVLAAIVVSSYYISIRFGKSIITYGVVLGLGISLGVIAVRFIPALLVFGAALYMINRLIVISDAKDLAKLDAGFLADHLMSLQVSALVFIIIARDYPFSGNTQASPLLIAAILVWYFVTILYIAKSLYKDYRRWSLSVPSE